MSRALSIAAAVAGLATGSTLACSNSSGPSADSPTAAAATLAFPTLTPQSSGTTNRLQAVSPVNDQVVWASGTGSTFVVTTDGGRTWRSGVVPSVRTLEFRDVEGISAKEAYLMAAGPGAASRVYKTTNGGKSWVLQFKNRREKAFYDCFAFWTPDRGITMSDAVNGVFPVIRTLNGETWNFIGGKLPAAQPGEAAFAASGTCVATQGTSQAWIGTGGAAKARILRTTDGGNTWRAFNTPIVQGTPASGIFTVAFRNASDGILAGGDLEHPDEHSKNVAVSNDGGRTWQLVAGTPFTGAAYGLSYAHGSRPRTVVITGPKGAAWSSDEGESWHTLAGVENYWAVAFANPKAGWLVGTDGRILKVSF
ncbi:MAG: WD40/YVTN/BNR-like repeat-containing protein [Gemmatimonadales bacterium]